jgi:hypothetical protein
VQEYVTRTHGLFVRWSGSPAFRCLRREGGAGMGDGGGGSRARWQRRADRGPIAGGERVVLGWAGAVGAAGALGGSRREGQGPAPGAPVVEPGLAGEGLGGGGLAGGGVDQEAPGGEAFGVHPELGE